MESLRDPAYGDDYHTSLPVATCATPLAPEHQRLLPHVARNDAVAISPIYRPHRAVWCPAHSFVFRILIALRDRVAILIALRDRVAILIALRDRVAIQSQVSPAGSAL